EAMREPRRCPQRAGWTYGVGQGIRTTCVAWVVTQQVQASCEQGARAVQRQGRQQVQPLLLRGPL
ncbi:MAG TPA: hypothetical protein DCY79_17120, partial [Planctomycetaceae bacterium]|nr:hypothetical protein [Planctomycetaceae bacterium]